MSRTNRGSKPPGYDFWSKRPYNKGGGGYGRSVKRMTHKAERKIGAGKFQVSRDDYEGF